MEVKVHFAIVVHKKETAINSIIKLWDKTHTYLYLLNQEIVMMSKIMFNYKLTYLFSKIIKIELNKKVTLSVLPTKIWLSLKHNILILIY